MIHGTTVTGSTYPCRGDRLAVTDRADNAGCDLTDRTATLAGLQLAVVRRSHTYGFSLPSGYGRRVETVQVKSVRPTDRPIGIPIRKVPS